MHSNVKQRNFTELSNYPGFTETISNKSPYIPIQTGVQYPSISDQIPRNNDPYVPKSLWNHDNEQKAAFQNQRSQQQSNLGRQTLNTVSAVGAQTAAINHLNVNRGAEMNPNYNQQELMKKDLENTLEGSARAGFIRKVYSLLTLQLLVTIGIGFWAYNSELFKNVFVNIPALVILTVLLIALSCVIGCATTFFKKWALPVFILFTIVFSLLIGISISNYKSHIILAAAGITFLLVVALTIYACVTKSDFTTFGPYLLVFCCALFIFGLACIFWRNPIVHLIYASLSALLFGIYLIFDTQLVLGRGQFSFTLDDAYLAALLIYIDVIQLFLQILSILGEFNR